MKNTAIIIPTRLAAKRFPNKPLAAKINNVPMIIHVLKSAIKSGVGEVYVSTPDREILEVVDKHGGNGILTGDHPNGTSRVWETFKKIKNENIDLVINMQGDQVMLSPNNILKLDKLMRKHNSPIGTLASKLIKDEINDYNIVKCEVETNLQEDSFLKAKDFFRIKKDLNHEKTYHHIGIYAFTNIALTKYVKLARSKLEIERNLEQMRALENNLIIKVGLSNSSPLGVDTKEDLEKISKEMKLS